MGDFSFFMEHDDSNFWFDAYILSLTLLLLPILPIFAPLLWILLYLNGEAKTLVSCLRKPDKTGYKSVSLLVEDFRN